MVDLNKKDNKQLIMRLMPAKTKNCNDYRCMDFEFKRPCRARGFSRCISIDLPSDEKVELFYEKMLKIVNEIEKGG